jgi:hypothetical protein
MLNFSLEFINKIPYLIPFGQAVSCGARAVRLNPTGAVMWQKLCEAHSSYGAGGDISYPLSDDLKSAWLSALCDQFEAYSDDDKATIERDALDFLEMLNREHVFRQSANVSTINEDSITKKFAIAGITISYTGPTRLYPEDFDEFEVDADLCQVNINVAGTLTRSYELGTPVIKTRDVCIFKMDYGYLILFDTFSVIRECELHTDGTVNLYYHLPSLKNSGKCIHAILNDIDYEHGVYETFHAMRLAFLHFSQQRGIFALHSASFLYRDRLWLVSAPAGTGKSTHAALWNKIFGAPTINGDLNCIDTNDAALTVKGSPWCGTSGIFDKNTYPLGGVILLSRGRENNITAINGDQATLAVANRLISPTWSEVMLKSNIEAAEKICKNSLVFALNCDMSEDAAKVCRDYIDKYLA